MRLITILTLTLSLFACNALEDLDEVEEQAQAKRDAQGECTSNDQCDDGDVCIDRFCQSALCQFYCDEAEDKCKGPNALYDDYQMCLDTCEDFPEVGLPDEPTGNTVHCRIYHLTLAAAVDPVTHCPHASATGSMVCVGASPCTSYCGSVLENCSGEPVFEDADACLAACAAYPKDGAPGDETGNTLQCRQTQATAASVNSGFHCPQASPESTECQGPPPAAEE
jgi:hypothetical protein